jgi:hypothetical protein
MGKHLKQINPRFEQQDYYSRGTLDYKKIMAERERKSQINSNNYSNSFYADQNRNNMNVKNSYSQPQQTYNYGYDGNYPLST